MSFLTAGSILNDCAVELGLLTADVANPYASTEANMVLLRRLLKSAGQDLLRSFAWSHLHLTHTFTTTPGVATYAMPAGFGRLVDQTAWNRTTQLPLGGPVSPQGWQLFKAQLAGGVVDLYFRVRGPALEVHPTPTSTVTLAFEYLTEFWVAPTNAFVPTQAEPTATGNYLLFDSYLLTRKLMLAWLQRRGFDASAAQLAYDEAYTRATSADGASPVLSLHRPAFGAGRLLDSANVPDTQVGG